MTLRPIQPQHTPAIKRVVGLHLITTNLKQNSARIDRTQMYFFKVHNKMR